jgi:riboflavin synthase
MFTGIIEGLGTVAALTSRSLGRRLEIQAGIDLNRTRIGDSIAVNGACLTVVALNGRRFAADVAPETLACTGLGQLALGERVNLERALRLSDRLDGHLVSGHVDGQGRIAARHPEGNAVVVEVALAASLARYLIPKGSVAVDGVSLTVNRCGPDRFWVSVIPHTAALTTIGFKPVGAAVNIETDMIGKYVERFLARGPENAPEERPAKGVSLDLLARSGYL